MVLDKISLCLLLLLECVQSESDILSISFPCTDIKHSRCKTASPPQSPPNLPRLSKLHDQCYQPILPSYLLLVSSYSLQSYDQCCNLRFCSNPHFVAPYSQQIPNQSASFASPRMPGLPAGGGRDTADVLADLNLAEFVMAEQDRTMTDEVFQITTELKGFMMQSAVNIEDAQARIEHANAYIRTSLQLTNTVVQECNVVLENLGQTSHENIQDDNLFAHVSASFLWRSNVS